MVARYSMKAMMTAAAFAGALTGWSVPAYADEQMWTASDRVNRRTCPSTECGIVGQLFFRESAVVLEKRNGWARISKYYDGSCTGGRSDYVDSGNASCTAGNGFDGGQFAEWVSLDLLVANRPADPGAGATGTAALVADSDDFRLHEAAFVAAAEKLIADGTCTAGNFREMGGWMKSMNNKTEPVYFTYCGAGGADRIYLNAGTGATYR